MSKSRSPAPVESYTTSSPFCNSKRHKDGIPSWSVVKQSESVNLHIVAGMFRILIWGITSTLALKGLVSKGFWAQRPYYIRLLGL